VKNIEPEWFPEPGELIQPEEPPKPKPDLRDFFKLGKPSEAPSKRLWSTPPPPAPPPVWSDEKRIRSAKNKDALKKYRLAQQLRRDWMFWAALRYYDAKLVPGEWIELGPARRERSRKLNCYWHSYLAAARRLLAIVYRSVKDEYGIVLHDKKGRTRNTYFIRHPVWKALQLALGFEIPETAQSGEEPGQIMSREESNRVLAEQKFIDKLFDPRTEIRFRKLPLTFTLGPIEEFTLEFDGTIFLHLVKRRLCRDYERLSLPPRPRLGSRPARKTPPPTPQEITVNAFAKTFLAKIRSAG
jgi:hypothetical protein